MPSPACTKELWWSSPTSEARMRASSTRAPSRSEEHTSELQSLTNLVCRLLLEKKKKIILKFCAYITMSNSRSCSDRRWSFIIRIPLSRLSVRSNQLYGYERATYSE